MAPFLFNLYLYGLLLVADQESWSGAEVEQTEVVSNEFADDIVLTHDDEGKLQENLTKINTVTANEGMEISKRKTECMWLAHPLVKEGSPCPPLVISLVSNGSQITRLNQVASYKYLGSMLETGGSMRKELDYKLERGRAKSFTLRKVLKMSQISISSKNKLVKRCILPAMLYSAETWSTKTSEISKLQTLINRALRFNRGLTLLDKYRTSELLITASIPPVESLISIRRMMYYGKVVKRSESCMTSAAIRWKPKQTTRGRPKKNWWKCIESDLERLGLKSHHDAHLLKKKLSSKEGIRKLVEQKRELLCDVCQAKYKCMGWLERHKRTKHTS